MAQRISWPALNQKVCALRSFYGVTLGQNEMRERVAYAREPRKPLVVLGADEVVRFLEVVPPLKARTALTAAYPPSRPSTAIARQMAASASRTTPS